MNTCAKFKVDSVSRFRTGARQVFTTLKTLSYEIPITMITATSNFLEETHFLIKLPSVKFYLKCIHLWHGKKVGPSPRTSRNSGNLRTPQVPLTPWTHCISMQNKETPSRHPPPPPDHPKALKNPSNLWVSTEPLGSPRISLGPPWDQCAFLFVETFIWCET